MWRLAMLAGPPLARYLWKRRKRRGMPAAVTDPDLDRPQAQVEAMERAVDVPGGVRP